MKSILVTLVTVLVIFSNPLRAETYRVIRLDTLLGTKDFHGPVAINDAGSIASSTTYASTNRTHASLYRDNGKGNIDLGVLTGTSSTAGDVNAVNAVVGTATLASGISRAALFSGVRNVITDLGTLDDAEPTYQSSATCINDDGDIVGSAETAGGIYHATLFSGSGSGNTDLGTLGGPTSGATGINSAGTIVGSAQNADGFTHAALFDKKGNIDLGTLGGNNSAALAINATGRIVGYAETAGFESHAAIFIPGNSPLDLGTLGGRTSSAAAVNVSGIIVGSSQFNKLTTARHAFIYQKTVMRDLNDLIPANSGVVLTSAIDINRDGQILATGIFSKGVYPVLLDPIAATYKITVSIKGKGKVKGAGKYEDGKKVTLVATPAKGAKFIRWTENGKTVSKNLKYSFKASSTRKLIAEFK